MILEETNSLLPSSPDNTFTALCGKVRPAFLKDSLSQVSSYLVQTGTALNTQSQGCGIEAAE